MKSIRFSFMSAVLVFCSICSLPAMSDSLLLNSEAAATEQSFSYNYLSPANISALEYVHGMSLSSKVLDDNNLEADFREAQTIVTGSGSAQVNTGVVLFVTSNDVSFGVYNARSLGMTIYPVDDRPG